MIALQCADRSLVACTILAAGVGQRLKNRGIDAHGLKLLSHQGQGLGVLRLAAEEPQPAAIDLASRWVGRRQWSAGRRCGKEDGGFHLLARDGWSAMHALRGPWCSLRACGFTLQQQQYSLINNID